MRCESRDSAIGDGLGDNGPRRRHHLDVVEKALPVTVSRQLLEEFGLDFALRVEDGLRILCQASIPERIAIESDSLTDRAVVAGSHKFHLGALRVAGTEHHAFRHDVSKFLGLHVSEHNHLVGQHLFQCHELLQTRHNRANATLRLTQVNLLDVQFLRVRVRFALHNLTNSDIALAVRLELLGKVTTGTRGRSASFLLWLVLCLIICTSFSLFGLLFL